MPAIPYWTHLFRHTTHILVSWLCFLLVSRFLFVCFALQDPMYKKDRGKKCCHNCWPPLNTDNIIFFSANERSKGEGKGKEEKGKEKGKGELEVKLWQKRKKLANAPAGNRTRDPSKRGWCSTIEPPRQAISPCSQFVWNFIRSASTSQHRHHPMPTYSWLTRFAFDLSFALKNVSSHLSHYFLQHLYMFWTNYPALPVISFFPWRNWELNTFWLCTSTKEKKTQRKSTLAADVCMCMYVRERESVCRCVSGSHYYKICHTQSL